MDQTIVDGLARKALAYLDSRPDNSRIIIVIAGVPKSGKTTVAAAVCRVINSARPPAPAEAPAGEEGHPAAAALAVAIPMDGFHYTRARLLAMPDPADATHRRGAAFTFDGEGYLALIRALAAAPAAPMVRAPSFDHALKDSVADAIAISVASRVVLVEGNYCALNRGPWLAAARLASRVWYVDAPAEVAHARLARRHLESGIVRDEAEAWERARGTDELNAQDVRANLVAVDEIIVSSG